MIRKAHAIWHGTGRDGQGEVTTESATLQAAPYAYRTRFEGAKGTNPEELIAAAHASCFTMALAFQLQAAGFAPDELRAEAAVTLEQDGQGFTISQSDLILQARIPDIGETQFQELARIAEQNCPVSKLLRARISLEAKLV